jgi:ABC-type long-subunit fatty acid transport system fused permease/ATPase subunit
MKELFMSKLKKKKTILIHSLIWAAAALLFAFIVKGSERAELMFMFFVIGWYISHRNIMKKFSTNSDTNNDTNNESCCS